jgi:hypothetical protein
MLIRTISHNPSLGNILVNKGSMSKEYDPKISVVGTGDSCGCAV